jgi:hypothetical protein
MISKTLFENVNGGLLKTTRRNTAMGGMRTILFGDFAELPPVLKGFNIEQARKEALGNSQIYNLCNRYNLVDLIRQRDHHLSRSSNLLGFQRVTDFIISRTVHK